MNDGYKTSDMFFCSALLYVFGEEALTRVTQEEKDSGRTLIEFHLDIPSLDASSYLQDFLKGEFAISDLKAFSKVYVGLTKILKTMAREGLDSWSSPSWVAGRG